MIKLSLRDPNIIENAKAIKELQLIGIYTDDELQEMYDRELQAALLKGNTDG